MFIRHLLALLDDDLLSNREIYPLLLRVYQGFVPSTFCNREFNPPVEHYIPYTKYAAALNRQEAVDRTLTDQTMVL